MSEFVVNRDMFGQFVKIPTGYSKEMHIYKVVSMFCSNTYCDVPIVHGTEPTYHEMDRKRDNPYGLETVLNVIHCGIDESTVIRVALKDCEIVNPRTNADRIRAMSDEELIKIIMCPYDTAGASIDIMPCVTELGVQELVSPEFCNQCMMKWLQKEVKE